MAEKEPGWFNDPYGRFQQRYFNGTKWTEHVATGGEQKVDPLGASTVIPIATPPTAFATGAKGAGVVKFLDAAGPDSRERPAPSIRSAVAGLGGLVLASGVFSAALGDDPSRGRIIAIALVVIAAAWALRTFVKVPEVQAAAVGMVVIAIPTFAVAATVSDGTGGFGTGLLMAVLFIAAWAFPGFKNRNLLLGLGALALVAAFGSLTSTDGGSSGSFLPALFTDNAGDQGAVYLLGGAIYFGLTWWLDRRGHRGTATAFAAAGLVSTLIGTVLFAAKFGENSAPIFVLAVGIIVSLVGSHGARRATTWWGALLTAIAVLWFVAVQWEPDSTAADGAVAIVAGIVLVAIPFATAPIRAAMQARSGSAPPGPPPPFTPSA